MVMVCTITRVARCTRANGPWTCRTAGGRRDGPMVLYLKAHSGMERSRALGVSHGPINAGMRANSTTTTCMVMGSTIGMMEEVILGSGEGMPWLRVARCGGLMVAATKV